MGDKLIQQMTQLYEDQNGYILQSEEDPNFSENDDMLVDFRRYTKDQLSALVLQHQTEPVKQITEVLFQFFSKSLLFNPFQLKLNEQTIEDWENICFEVIQITDKPEHKVLRSWYDLRLNQGLEACLRSFKKLHFKKKETVWDSWKRDFDNTKLALFISVTLIPDSVVLEADFNLTNIDRDQIDRINSSKVFSTRDMLEAIHINITDYLTSDWMFKLSSVISRLWYSSNPKHIEFASDYYQLKQNKEEHFILLNDIRVNGLNWFLLNRFKSPGLTPCPLNQMDWNPNTFIIKDWTSERILNMLSSKLNMDPEIVGESLHDTHISCNKIRICMKKCCKVQTLLRLLGSPLPLEQIHNEISESL